MNANQFVEHIFTTATDSSDRNLELLLGTQAWRVGNFNPERIFELRRTFLSLPASDRMAIQKLFAFQFVRETTNTTFNTSNSTNSSFMLNGLPSLGAVDTSSNIRQSTYDAWATLSPAGREFIHALKPDFKNGPSARTDFSETLYQSFAMKLKAGAAKGTFDVSDSQGTFRLSANSYDRNGVLGYTVVRFNVNKQFSLNADVPLFITVGDRVKINLQIINTAATALTFTVTSSNINQAVSFTLPPKPVSAKPALTTLVPLVLQGVTATNMTQISLTVSTVANGFPMSDTFTANVRVLSPNVIRSTTTGGLLSTQNKQKTLPSR